MTVSKPSKRKIRIILALAFLFIASTAISFTQVRNSNEAMINDPKEEINSPINEAHLEVEDWMKSPFKYNYEANIEIESWMTRPFTVST